MARVIFLTSVIVTLALLPRAISGSNEPNYISMSGEKFIEVMQLLSKGVNNGTGDEAKMTITMESHDEDVSWIIRQTIESIDQAMKSSPIVTSSFVTDEESSGEGEESFDAFFNDTVYECKKHPKRRTTEGFGSSSNISGIGTEKLLIPPVHSFYGTIGQKDALANAATVIKTHGLIENGHLTIYSTLSSKLTYEQEHKLAQLTSRSATNDTETNIEPSDKANKGSNSSSSASASSSSSSFASAPATSSIASSAAPARVWSNAVVSMLTDLFKDLIMRAMHNLLTKALDNLDDGGRVASLLRCEVDSFQCFIDERFDAVGLRLCVSSLISCLRVHMPKTGESIDLEIP